MVDYYITLCCAWNLLQEHTCKIKKKLLFKSVQITKCYTNYRVIKLYIEQDLGIESCANKISPPPHPTVVPAPEPKEDANWVPMDWLLTLKLKLHSSQFVP